MDPDELLDRLREAVRNGLSDPENNYPEVCEMFRDLDEWLSKGGFQPEAWSSVRIRMGYVRDGS